MTATSSQPSADLDDRRAGPYRLSAASLLVLLVYGGSILLIHLGDTRVLTRHETFAAQPAREMLQYPHSTKWIVPTLAGVYRTAKPPGMMWLIAASMAIFRSQAEWAARLPSALAALAVALMIAGITARWLGERLGLLAGLLQVSFVYIIMQAKLCEADMSLGAAVCCAMCCFALANIDAPGGSVGRGGRFLLSTIFYLAAAAMFMLKGPIGLLFIFSTAFIYWAIRREARIGWFLANPLGIVVLLFFVVGWPLAAKHIDPDIARAWKSETGGSVGGKLGHEGPFYYFYMVPLMLMPWLPLVVIGIWQGWKRGALRRPFGQFLACWFVPGMIFLELMGEKHQHYPIPIFPPLTVAAAVGLDFYLRKQHAMERPKHRLAAALFLIGCAAAILGVRLAPKFPVPMRAPVIDFIAVIAIGGLLSIYAEHRKSRFWQLAAYFGTAWLVAVGVQTFIMPIQDDYHFQKDFALKADGLVPPGKTIYLLGRREEEHEAQYAYYLRFPMQRYDQFADFREKVAPVAREPMYVIIPHIMDSELSALGPTQVLTQCNGLRLHETDDDRVELVKLNLVR